MDISCPRCDSKKIKTQHVSLPNGGHHVKVVCRACGRVEDFSNCDVSSLVDQLGHATDYQIEGHWLEVYGRCRTCRAAEPNSPGSASPPSPRASGFSPTTTQAGVKP